MVTNPYPNRKITQKNSETIGNPKGTQWFQGKNHREPRRNLKEPGHKSLSKSKIYTKELRSHREPKRNPMVSGEKPSGTQKEPKGTYGHKSLSKSKITQKNSEAIGNPKGTQWFLGKNPREPKRNLMLRPKTMRPVYIGQEKWFLHNGTDSGKKLMHVHQN